jgi:hypothetical protein
MTAPALLPPLRVVDGEGAPRTLVSAGDTVELRCDESRDATYHWEELEGATPTKDDRRRSTFGWTVPQELAGQTYTAQIHVEIPGDETDPRLTEPLEIVVGGLGTAAQAQIIANEFRHLAAPMQRLVDADRFG